MLNLRQAALYLGVSFWSVRDYVSAGWIPPIELPGLRPREGERQKQTLRRVLVDLRDLDRFIESRKEAGASDIQSRARPIEAGTTRANPAAVPNLCP